jgi:hypothetical protein
MSTDICVLTGVNGKTLGQYNIYRHELVDFVYYYQHERHTTIPVNCHNNRHHAIYGSDQLTTDHLAL